MTDNPLALVQPGAFFALTGTMDVGVPGGATQKHVFLRIDQAHGSFCQPMPPEQAKALAEKIIETADKAIAANALITPASELVVARDNGDALRP